MNNERPKLRPVEAFPAESNGMKLIGLRDPHKLTDKMVLLPQPAFFIVTLLDGNHTYSDIKLKFTRQFGSILMQSDIDKIVSDLDAAFFLENENFIKHYEKLVEDFKDKPFREAAHAGSAYPADKHGVKTLLQELMKNTPEDNETAPEGKTLRALVSPHIDYFRGGPCYGHAYKVLKQQAGVKHFIIFGTSHYGGKDLFIFTKKDYNTPLGRLKTNADFVGKLEKRLGLNLCVEEFLHKNEHSIELQAVFIKALFPGDDVSIVPVLCGSFYEMMEKGKEEEKEKHIQSVISAMKDIVKDDAPDTVVLAAADLSHVGLMFGDANPVTPGALDALREKDLETLKCAQDTACGRFYDNVAVDVNERKICGTAPIYYTMMFAEGCEGKLLNYDQWYGREQGSTVTFASMAFFK